MKRQIPPEKGSAKYPLSPYKKLILPALHSSNKALINKDQKIYELKFDFTGLMALSFFREQGMIILRNFFLVGGFLMLGGCTVFSSFSEVDALNETQAVGSPFTQALADEYRAFANRELRDMFDYPDALHFARKGLAAASGETVLPEPVSDWSLEPQAIQELSAARGRLIIAFDWGARETRPVLAAQAQAAYDCWIEGQEENWDDSGDMFCKTRFQEIMAELEAGLEPPVQEPVVFEPPPEEPAMFDVDASEPMKPEDAVYLVFFDWDKSNLTVGALNVIDAVAEEVSKNPPQTITIVGHTDTSGPTLYNERLAFRRANSVRDALIERNVDPSLIVVDAKGESELLVPTEDGVREPANRRANISFY